MELENYQKKEAGERERKVEYIFLPFSETSE